MHDLSQLLDALRKLNELERLSRSERAKVFSPQERLVYVERLRRLLPTSLLGHHDRLVARGKPSLATVRNGVCGACHLQLPSGHSRPKVEVDLDVCDNCGVFLEWPEPEMEPPQPASSIKTRRRSKPVKCESVPA